MMVEEKEKREEKGKEKSIEGRDSSGLEMRKGREES